MAPDGASGSACGAPPSSFESLDQSPLPPPTQPIDVPPTDKRLYRAISLPNGMQALLIHDPDMAAEVKEGKAGGGGNAEKGDDDESNGERSDDESDDGSSDDSEGASRGSSLADGAITDSESDSEDEIGKKKKKGKEKPRDENDDGDDEENDAEEGDEEEEASKVKKAAAAVAVGVGSLCDPEKMQGLAHYLEHMLFMGSKKYPDENDYDAFLARHGGMSNAYTELEATVYYFDAKPQALPGALSRFAQFFVAPLCKAGALEREVKAIENEFSGVKQSDSCRLAQLRCQTAREVEVEVEVEEEDGKKKKKEKEKVTGHEKQKHPFSRFFWGNRASLFDVPRSQGIDIRAEVVQFQESLYCAERMSLVILGGHYLEEMEEMARAEFGLVKSGSGGGDGNGGGDGGDSSGQIPRPLLLPRPRPTFESAGPPYAGGSLHVLPAVKAGHVLHVAFCLPPLLGKRYRAKAEEYCSHLVGHEGAGSLLSCLKRKGWASALCAGVGDGGTDRSTAAFVFEVAVTLTEAGLRGEGKEKETGKEKDGGGATGTAAGDGINNDDENPLLTGKGCGLAVARTIFRYLALLRGEGPQQWVQEEVAAVSAARFKFSGEEEEASEFVARLAESLHHHPPAHALSAPYLHDDWDPRLVSAVLGELRPRKARIDLRSSAFAVPKKKREEEEKDPEVLPSASAEAAPSSSSTISSSPLQRWASRIPGARIEHEPWFDFDFGIAPLPEELVARWEEESDEVEARAWARSAAAAAAAAKGASIAADAVAAAAADADDEEGHALPPRNCYIATDFSLRCEDDKGGSGEGPTASAAPASLLPPTLPMPPASATGGDGIGDGEAEPFAKSITPLCQPPSLLLDEPGLRLWHKLDASFRVPKASLHAHFTPAVPFSDPLAFGGGARGVAAAHLCSRLLDDALCEEAYLADVAGLSVDGWPEGCAGMEVRVEGFSHRLPELSAAAFSALGRLSSGGGGGGSATGGGGGPSKKFDFSSAFGRAREALAREYRNSHVRPERHAAHLRLACLKRLWAPLEVAEALEGLATPEALEALAPALLAGTFPPPPPPPPSSSSSSSENGDEAGKPRGNHLELLVQGNVSASEAAALARAARAALPPFQESSSSSSSPSPLLLPAACRPEERVALLPRGSSHLLRAPTLNPDEPNSVVEVYFQLGPDTPRARAVLDLVAHAAAEPCYNRLRTREQLGYSVHAGARSTHGVLGYCVVVVSSGGENGEHSPEHVDARIDAWMAEFGRRLERGGGGGGGEEDGNGAEESTTPPPTKTSTTTPDAKKHRKSSSSAPTTPTAVDLAADAPPISDAELAQHVAALRALKSQSERSLSDEAERHWERSGGGGKSYDFLCREEELAELSRVTRADAVALWRDWLAPGGCERRRLTVHVCGGAFRERALLSSSLPEKDAAAAAAAAAAPENVVLMREAEALRASLPQAPSRAAEGEARAQSWRAAPAAMATATATTTAMETQ